MSSLTPKPRIAVTGFMGVGKSTVSRHLARLVDTSWIDLDLEIEKAERRSIAEILADGGIEAFRVAESDALERVLDDEEFSIISLGGGAFTVEANRIALRERGVTSIWLEASFEHCWANIRHSYKDRPLARDRKQAESLYRERIESYCLADWHFIVQPGCNSYVVAAQIADEVYGIHP